MTNLTIPNNFPFMKYAPKTVPGLTDVAIHGQELNATVPDPELTPLFLDLDRI